MRLRRWLLPLPLACAWASSAFGQRESDQAAPTILRRVLDAAGGEAALRQIAATRSDVIQVRFAVGQEQIPGGLPPLRLISGELHQDFGRRRRALIGQQRHRHHTFGYRRISSTEAGLTEAWGEPAFNTGSDGIASDLQAMRYSPERILLTVYDAKCRSSPTGRAADAVALLCIDNGQSFTVRLDPRTNRLVSREETTTDERGRRRVTRVRYDDHRPVQAAPVVVAHQMQTEVNGAVTEFVQFGRIAAIDRAPDSLFALGPDCQSAARSTSAIPVNVIPLTESAFHVQSDAYYSLAVVQGDSLVLVDVPESIARTQAIMDTLRVRFSRSPLRLAVTSHNHGDHVGGTAAVTRAGVPVLTHVVNVGWLRELEAAPAGRPSRVRGLTGPITIGTGPSALRVYPVFNPHAAGTLLVYQPATRLLYAADLAESGPWEVEREGLLKNVEDLGIVVDRVAPGHGQALDWNDFVAAVRAGRSP